MKIFSLGVLVMLIMYVLFVGIENKGFGRRCILLLSLFDVVFVIDNYCNIYVCKYVICVFLEVIIGIYKVII